MGKRLFTEKDVSRTYAENGAGKDEKDVNDISVLGRGSDGVACEAKARWQEWVHSN